MREIIFKGKRVDNGEWVYGGVCQGEMWTEILSIKDIAGDSYTPDTSEIIEHDVVPETVGQYTGLTDKNGTKIFEHDIVKCTDKTKRQTLIFCYGLKWKKAVLLLK